MEINSYIDTWTKIINTVNLFKEPKKYMRGRVRVGGRVRVRVRVRVRGRGRGRGRGGWGG